MRTTTIGSLLRTLNHLLKYEGAKEDTEVLFWVDSRIGEMVITKSLGGGEEGLIRFECADQLSAGGQVVLSRVEDLSD